MPNEEPSPAALDGLIADAQTALVGAAQSRLGEFLDEEEIRLAHWQEDARVSFETKIKALGKEAKEKDKLARASVNLQGARSRSSARRRPCVARPTTSTINSTPG